MKIQQNYIDAREMVGGFEAAHCPYRPICAVARTGTNNHASRQGQERAAG